MSDNGAHGGGRGGRGGGSARGGGGGRGNRNNNRRRTGSSRRVVIHRTDSNTAPAPAVTYRPIGDDAVEKIGREVSELVIASRSDDCTHLETLLGQIRKKDPQLLRIVLGHTTTFAFPQGTFLAAACSNGKAAAADVLLRYGADPNQQCPSGSTALHLACYYGKVDCTRLLLGLPGTLRGPMVFAGAAEPRAASPRVIPACGTHALIHACRCASEKKAEETVDALLKADPSLPARAAEGALALHAAAESGFPRVLEMLLSHEYFPGGEPPEGHGKEMQLAWLSRDNLCALQVAEIKCETEMKREREKQQQALRASSRSGGGGGRGGGQQQRRGADNGGSRGGRGGGRNGGGSGGGRRGNSSRGRGGQGGAVEGAASEGGESGDGGADAAIAGGEREGEGAGEGNAAGGGGEKAVQEEKEVLEGGWGCVLVLMRASSPSIRKTLHGSVSLKTDAVRHRMFSYLGLHALVEDIQRQGQQAMTEGGGNRDLADTVSDYTMSIVSHLSVMYKAIIKAPRGASNQATHTLSSQLLAELIRPRDGREHVLDDVTCSLLLEIVVNSSANPHVVRPVVLLLTEIANTYQTSIQSQPAAAAVAVAVSGETGNGAGGKTTLSAAKAPPEGVNDGATTTTVMKVDPLREPSTPACCWFHQLIGEDTKARSPPATAPAFHAQACLRVWKCVCTCIARLGKMLLYGLQGQQEGEHGEVLYDREGALFDALWELLLRFLVPYAGEAASFLSTPPKDGQSPTHAILKGWVGADDQFTSLWAGLGQALSVVEGVVGGTEPDRFGALLRGYLIYLHLTNASQDHYTDIVKVVKDNKVETGLAGGAAVMNASGGGGRRVSRGRNPKNIITVVAAETSLGIPEAFKALVVEHSDAMEEILEADPAVLENRLFVLLRIEGAVETPQKLNYILSSLESRAGQSKGLDLSVNRMAGPREVVEMAMQQLAAASPKAIMAQLPELKFVNEQGEGEGPMRELIDLLSVVFSTTGGPAPETTAGPAEPPAPPNPSTPSSSSPPKTRRVIAAIAAAAMDAFPPRSVPNPSGSVLAAAAAAPPFVMPGTAPDAEAQSPSEIARLAAASLASAGAATSTGSDGSGGGGGGRAGETAARSAARSAAAAAAGGGGGSGFWKCWPLFRVHEPDPAAVVPRGGAGWENAAAESAAKAKAKVKEDAESRLRFFRAAGRVIAMSLVSGTPLGVVVPDAVWSVLLGSTPSWEEFCGRDSQYLASMQKVLEHEFGQEEGGNGMELYFCVSERVDGKTTDVPLVPGGDSKRVTDGNKKEFVDKATRRRALGGAEQAISAIRSGMGDVIPKNLLSVLLPSEVASIVSGPQGEVDMASLQANIWYVDLVDEGFGANHKVIRWFWEWAMALEESDRRKLLLFWSGSSRVPPFGFEDAALNEDHRWTIGKGRVEDACPHASTCDRRMNLPVYSSREAAFKYLTATVELGYLGYTDV